MTKVLHQVGHNHKWNLDAFFENGIGDGFILTAYSIEKDKICSQISGYKADNYIPVSMLDLQFYGSKKSKGGKLDTYDFHPIKFLEEDETQLSTKDGILKSIQFQENCGFKKIIIPVIYKEASGVDDLINIIKSVNLNLKKKNGVEYYMTIPLSYTLIQDDFNLEKVLLNITDLNIKFDGFYIVNEVGLKTNQKVSTEYLRYENLLKVFQVLHKEDYKIIYGYANWDALIFLSLVDIDYISIGTYEVLRNFYIDRFTEEKSGGPSDGWYFSEKLLNCIRASEIQNLRKNNALSLIANEDNIFSETILNEGYIWNTHKPDVHKNYLLAIDRMIKKLVEIKNIKDRASFMFNKIEEAERIYSELEMKKVFLTDANSNYHLSFWKSFLKSKIN
jgi:hypothetical protein